MWYYAFVHICSRRIRRYCFSLGWTHIDCIFESLHRVRVVSVAFLQYPVCCVKRIQLMKIIIKYLLRGTNTTESWLSRTTVCAFTVKTYKLAIPLYYSGSYFRLSLHLVISVLYNATELKQTCACLLHWFWLIINASYAQVTSLKHNSKSVTVNDKDAWCCCMNITVWLLHAS